MNCANFVILLCRGKKSIRSTARVPLRAPDPIISTKRSARRNQRRVVICMLKGNWFLSNKNSIEIQVLI